MPGPSIHAVFYVLNDLPFFRASLAAVYDAVSGVTVVTTRDRDRYGRPVEPDGLVDLVLSREIDPDRKISLIATTEGSEPRARNRAISYATEASRVVSLAGEPPGVPPVDLLWHIDADEIYDRDDVERLLGWIHDHPARVYLLELRSYFRSWNYRIEEKGTFVALSKPGFRFGNVREPYPGVWARGWRKLVRTGVVPNALAHRMVGAVAVPPQVAVCHHGSYVGDRSRIATKLAASAHTAEIAEDWLVRVWDGFTPAMRDFHPAWPSTFPSAQHIPTSELPSAIRDHRWPDGWIERD